MYVPKMLPEEHLAGYRGRLRLYNELSRSELVTASFQGGTPQRSRPSLVRIPFVEATAMAMGCSLFQVVMGHTLWPFSGALDRPAREVSVEAFARSRPGRTAVMRTIGSAAKLCRNCVTEDLDFWGLSYWRRAHQISGIVACDKHGSRLERVDRAALEEGMPHHVLHRSRFENEDDVARLPLVQRFSLLATTILQSGPILQRRAVAEVLRCEWGGDKRPELERQTAEALFHRARSMAPDAWLREAVPKSAWGPDAQTDALSPALGKWSRPPSMAMVVLCLAVAFEEPPEALLFALAAAPVLAGPEALRFKFERMH